MEVDYVVGDATKPQPFKSEPMIITHICNDVGGWGAGFVLALSKMSPLPERQYRNWAASEEGLRLGSVGFVDIEDGLVVANLVGQRGHRWQDGVPPVRYPAIHFGLVTIAGYAKATGSSVHMPRIGCGLAGGEWDKIEPMLENTMLRYKIGIRVYDLEE